MYGKDGGRYVFLCKRETKGDMRKDQRMMDVATVLNRLFKANHNTRKSKTHLRTFAVLLMSQESGLIEWVPKSSAMRSLINQCETELGRSVECV